MYTFFRRFGIDDDKLEDVYAVFKENVPRGGGLTAVNLVENKTVIQTDEITVSLENSSADKVRTSVRDGRKCLVIDIDDPSVIVNGVITKMWGAAL